MLGSLSTPHRALVHRKKAGLTGLDGVASCVRNADTLKKLQLAEKQLKDQREAAYVDLAKSEEERKLGNEARASPCAHACASKGVVLGCR